MSGVLPFEVQVCPSPQGHGYVRLKVDRPNPYFPVGLEIKGHEFHYSRVVAGSDPPPTACAVERGTGCFEGRDGAFTRNVWASYTHIHALGAPAWADGIAQAAAAYSASRRVLV
jgi:cobyrinic acid a,c-diamide synthase